MEAEPRTVLVEELRCAVETSIRYQEDLWGILVLNSHEGPNLGGSISPFLMPNLKAKLSDSINFCTLALMRLRELQTLPSQPYCLERHQVAPRPSSASASSLNSLKPPVPLPHLKVPVRPDACQGPPSTAPAHNNFSIYTAFWGDQVAGGPSDISAILPPPLQPCSSPPLKELGSASLSCSSDAAVVRQPTRRFSGGRSDSRQCYLPAGADPDKDIPEDGYNWRKYGRKKIRNSIFDRGYYRCSATDETQSAKENKRIACKAKKQVQRSNSDPDLFNVHYWGHHTCTTSARPRPITRQQPWRRHTPSSLLLPLDTDAACTSDSSIASDFQDQDMSSLSDFSALWIDSCHAPAPAPAPVAPSSSGQMLLKDMATLLLGDDVMDQNFPTPPH